MTATESPRTLATGTDAADPHPTIQFVLDFELPDDEEENVAQAEFERSLAEAQKEDDDGLSPDGDAAEDGEEDIELEIVLGALPGKPAPELDWEAIVVDADEFDEAPTREELAQVRSQGHVSREQRALQQAIELGQEFGWDQDGIEILAEVFVRHWWSAAKESMRRELRAGMQPEEPRLALEVRAVWAAHPEFATDFGRPSRHDHRASAVYRVLSWPLALALVRSTRGYPDIDYLEHMLCELFDHWYTHTSLRRRIPVFNTYLYFRFASLGQERLEGLEWTFEPDEALFLVFNEHYEPGHTTTESRVLDSLGLIPRILPSFRPQERDKPNHVSTSPKAGPRQGKDAPKAEHAPKIPDQDEQTSQAPTGILHIARRPAHDPAALEG